MFRNRDGHAVDPVPFLVVTGFALLGSFTFVPVYVLTLGLSVELSVGAGVVVFGALTAVAYHQMVWSSSPELQGEIPAETRLLRLFYAALVVGVVMLSLTLLLLSR